MPADVRPARQGRPSLRATVTEQIKRYIIDSELRPGDPLPTEGELCETLNVSRSSLREAIKTLAALDIVEVRHGFGTYVGRLSLTALVESLTFRGLLSPTDDFRVLLDLIQVRQLFEQGMATQIVERLDVDRLTALDDLVAGLERCHDSGTSFVDTDRAFHRLLMEPLGNELISQLTGAFWDVYALVAPHLGLADRQEETETIAAHRAMVDAARARDVTAFVAAVEAHYAPVRRRITAATEQHPPHQR
ncbi:FadR/GntR family transcriptional regulator [Actinoplanes sp. DH11]|uniref:FadR/GntR family transcriptional regulator n=1 Tax=Actinoplanes sp. DH11 TaxID=2857011 RepID=UPI001E3B7955|nr:FadR/GntR family transcriptional regulator [Actinoplanes sp. DH11]